MNEDQPHLSDPFDQNIIARRNTPPELIELNAALFLETLAELRSTSPIEPLRRAVQLVCEQIHDPNHPLREYGDEETTIQFNTDLLAADLAQITEAHTLERAHYYIKRLMKSITAVRTSSINDINLNRWKEYDDIYTDSLWLIERRDSSGAHHAGYWGNFVPQIPYQLMRRYTRPGEWVLDPFAGSGTTLLEGQRLGRHTIGVDLQSAMVEQVRGLIASEPNRHNVVTEVHYGDSTTIDYAGLLQRHGRKTAQLAILHPPYYDIIKFSDDTRDLSNAGSVDDFLAMLGQVVDNIAPLLERGRYLALVIGDKYLHGDWVPLGFQSMNEIMRRGFSLKSIIVKNFEGTAGKRTQKELWRYRALVSGFYIFKHEYIFLFRKP